MATLKSAALHEAAHIVCAMARGLAVESAEVSDDGSGVVFYDTPEIMLNAGARALDVSMAFAVASCAPIAVGEAMSESDSEFLNRAIWLSGLAEDRQFLRCEFARLAAKAIRENRAAFDRVTAALIARKKLTGAEIAALMEGQIR